MGGFYTYGNSLTSFDPDALEFISNWEALPSTPSTMGVTQRSAIFDLFKGLKGQAGTTHLTNFWNDLESRGARIYPLVPNDDINAVASAYELDLVSKGVLSGSYVGFAGADITALGVTGGTGKYFNMSVDSDTFDINSNMFGVYSRTNTQENLISIGERGAASFNGNTLALRTTLNATSYRINNALPLSDANMDGSGLIYAFNTTANVKATVRNTTLLSTNTQANIGQNAQSKYAHALNDNGTAALFSAKQLCMYFDGVQYLDPNQRDDWYTIWQRFQSNIITGGRQIGVAIPPI